MERDKNKKQVLVYQWDFNSHAHVERDNTNPYYTISVNISTHTLTWSVTLEYSDSRGQTGNFNSHAHVERDFPLQFAPYHLCNFNSHAHVERDPLKSDNLPVFSHFNSHAHVERDKIMIYKQLQLVHFNSHAHVERDDTEEKSEQSFCISTHTLTWSVTLS